MKGRDKIINFLVVFALLGYIFCSLKLFVEVLDLFSLGKEEPSLVFMNITSALTGLVGGIVAAAFGVKVDNPQDPSDPQNLGVPPILGNPPVQSIRSAKFQSVGSMATGINNGSKREKMGNLYAWSYILTGVASVLIWAILSDNAPQNIANMGTTFLGMMIAIVSAYFRPTV